jgi:GTP-binding protein
MDLKDFRDLVEHRFPHLRGAPLLMISNESGKGLDRVMKAAFRLHEEAGNRVGTGELNRGVQKTFDKLRFRGRSEKPRAFYATQLRVHPPTFLLFVNRTKLFEKEVVRAITRELRKYLGYTHVPIRIVLRARKRSPSKRG